MKRLIGAAILFILSSLPCMAASEGWVVPTCPASLTTPYTMPGFAAISVDPNGNQCIVVSVSASITGFTPNGNFAVLTSAGTSGSVALPAGTTVAFQNTGTTTVSCTLGVGSALATANEIQVPASSTVFVTPGSNTFGACIDQTGSTSNTIVLAGGSGLGTGFGGGGGGGSGGTVNQGSPNGGGANAWPVVDSAVASALTTGSGWLQTIATNTGAAVPAGTNVIGKVGIDQTTPGTTNGVQVNAALPAGTNTIGNVGSDPSSGKGTPSSVAINVSTATTTQLVALSGSTKIYVTSYDVIAAGTGNITFEYGTGTACATGTTALTGAYNLTAQAGIAKGNGIGAVLVVPAGNALCVLTSAGVQMSGSVSFQQF